MGMVLFLGSPLSSTLFLGCGAVVVVAIVVRVRGGVRAGRFLRRPMLHLIRQLVHLPATSRRAYWSLPPGARKSKKPSVLLSRNSRMGRGLCL
ncbi:hypothetical protein BKA80DRAFT_267097 [Phyllosticta citrichinensis]